MDAKALAKSKRAHSLHHKKKHQPHQLPKAPSVVSGEKKPSGKQANERPQQPQGQQAKPKSHGPRPLPSNWGRYDEDFDLDSEEAQSSLSQPSEFVVPKSKGADYAHLISEAKAQSQPHYSPDDLHMFDDFINDFTQDFSPMLAAKGQTILSWIADDSFEFEGKTSTSLEAPFLSLNLNALGEQLTKAKLSQRLYLEPDLLPLELIDEEELHQSSEDQHETSSGPSSISSDQQLLTNIQQQHPQPSSSPTIVTDDIPVHTSERALKATKQNTVKSQGTHRSILVESVSGSVVDSIPGKLSRFEAANAEAELDMLLNSLGESMMPEPSGENLKKGNIDDDIDNLLEETASLKMTDGRWVSDGVKVHSETISSTVDPGSNSKLLDDFDSWLDTI